MKIKCSYIILVLATSFSLQMLAQSDSLNNKPEIVSSYWKSQGLTLGLIASGYSYGELGYYRNFVWEVGHFQITSRTVSFGLEFSYFDNLILAPKILGRIHIFFIDASISGLFYSNLNTKYAIRLRPEIGVGLWNFDVNFGCNLGLYTNEFKNISKYVFSFRYYLPMKRKYLNK